MDIQEQIQEAERRTFLVNQHDLKLYKFVLLDDLKSILTVGLLSKSEVEKRADSPPRTATRSADEFAPGDRVKHARFGEGSVVSLSGSGSETKARVAFDKARSGEYFGAVNLLLSSNTIWHEADESPYYVDISNQDVQERRSVREIRLPHGKIVKLHDCVPFYLVPRTPTSYIHYVNGHQDRMVFIDIDTKVITEWDREIIFTTGNASSSTAILHRDLEALGELPWNVLQAPRWAELPDGKNLRCSEFLIYPMVLPKFFKRLVVNSKESQIKVRAVLNQLNQELPVDIDQSYFFPSDSNIDHAQEALPLPF